MFVSELFDTTFLTFHHSSDSKVLPSFVHFPLKKKIFFICEYHLTSCSKLPKSAFHRYLFSSFSSNALAVSNFSLLKGVDALIFFFYTKVTCNQRFLNDLLLLTEVYSLTVNFLLNPDHGVLVVCYNLYVSIPLLK